MHELRFGFKTAQQHSTWEEILTVWQEAEDIPAFTHGWLFDHLNPIDNPDGIGDCFEGWTMLSALAAHTKRLRLGLLTGCNTYRDPALHAQMAATVDVISGGRVDFGDGAGWNEFEHRSRNIELPTPGKRLRMLEEAIEIARWMVAWALRNLGRTGEALAAQRALKADLAAAGRDDPFVDEELAILEGR